MSYWVSLNHRVVTRSERTDGSGGWEETESWEPVQVEAFEDGGTYVAGGSCQAELNITYNYGKWFWEHLGEGGLRALDGDRAGAWVDRLARMVEACGTERDRDYWAATPGNAGAAAARLLAWARQHPDARFSVS